MSAWINTPRGRELEARARRDLRGSTAAASAAPARSSSTPARFDPSPEFIARQRLAAERTAAIAASNRRASPARSSSITSTPRAAAAPVRGVFVSGYATLFGVKSVGREQIPVAFVPGAFAARLRDLAARPVAALWGHDPFDKLGATTADGTLVLEEDDRGLRFAMALTGAAAARVRANRRGLGVSPAWGIARSLHVPSSSARAVVAWSADLNEISLTNDPAMRETIDLLHVEELDG